jgi:UDP-N-acetylmuramoylalanine--D-glutamate ligase
MSLLKKKVLVIGLGKTGLSVSRWLTNQGAEVTVSDIKKKTDIDSDLVNEISKVGVTLETGGHKMETFFNSDMIVVSPGVPLDLDPIVSSPRPPSWVL